MTFTLFYTPSSKACELQSLHNLRKLFVQDLTTRVKQVSTMECEVFVLIVLLKPFLKLRHQSMWHCAHRALKWNLMIVEGFPRKSKRFPFLRTTWNSLQKYTNRSVCQNGFAGDIKDDVWNIHSQIIFISHFSFTLIRFFSSPAL